MNIHDIRQLESTAAHVARSEHEVRSVTVATVPPTPDTEPNDYSSVDFNPKTMRGAPPPLTVGPIFGNSSVPEKYSVILADGCVTYGGKLPEEPPSTATDELYGVDYITVDGSPGDILYCHFILEQENESESTETKTYKFLRFEFSTSESPESLTEGQESLTFRIAKLGGAPWSTHQYVVGALHIGGGGGGGGGTSKRRPNPFEVHLFDADADEDWEKGYAVWMEDLDHLASINGQYVTIENVRYANVYDENTGYGSWYFLDDETLTFGQTLYLVLTPERGESEGPKARLQTTPGTDADSVSVAIATIDAANIGGELEPRDIWQHVTSAVIVSTGGGGTTNVASETVVGIDFDYLIPSDKDWEKHPYAIKFRRGYLRMKNGKLTVEEDEGLARYLDTTPYSETYNDAGTSS